MFKAISTFFRHLFTGRDGQTFDLGRVLWALAVLWFLGMGVVAVWLHGQNFDALGFGGGAAAVLGGGGAALGLKSKTEPGAD